LQKNDVLVSFDGKKVTGWPSLVSALQARRAGDKVPVVFYRGREKKSVTMELSRRALPEVPSTAEALAGAMHRTYIETNAELAQCFEGVSEEDASHRPAPDAWSAKETVAHLIIGERDNHAWMADLIVGQERWSDDWTGNILVRHRATAVVYSTLPALLEELGRNQAETVAMLAALPPEFVARKGSYWRLGYSLLTLADHTCEHLGQIRAAIEAARKQ
ncbi:MAG: DinB family protein, partial [Vicinamibacterales bacterium]